MRMITTLAGRGRASNQTGSTNYLTFHLSTPLPGGIAQNNQTHTHRGLLKSNYEHNFAVSIDHKQPTKKRLMSCGQLLTAVY